MATAGRTGGAILRGIVLVFALALGCGSHPLAGALVGDGGVEASVDVQGLDATALEAAVVVDGGLESFDAAGANLSTQAALSPTDQACSERLLSACDADATCRYIGASTGGSTLLVAAALCWRPPGIVGCRASGLICGAAGTVALDPTGQCYRFSDTCIPIGWREVDVEHQPPRCSTATVTYCGT